MTQLEVPQNRVDVPMRADALLEVIHQPLYSAAAFLNGVIIPFSTEVFSYRIGQVVPGAGAGAIASTINHTNMTQAGTLSHPKVGEFRSVRQVMCQLTAPLTTPITPTFDATPPEPGFIFELVQQFFWGTTLRFHVGEKDYLEGVPSFLVPGNVGIGGVAAVSADDQADAEQQQVVLPNGAGRTFDLEPYAVFLPSQQQFFAQIRAPQPIPPTPGVDCLVWVIIDSVIGREVM